MGSTSSFIRSRYLVMVYSMSPMCWVPSETSRQHLPPTQQCRCYYSRFTYKEVGGGRLKSRAEISIHFMSDSKIHAILIMPAGSISNFWSAQRPEYLWTYTQITVGRLLIMEPEGFFWLKKKSCWCLGIAHECVGREGARRERQSERGQKKVSPLMFLL